MSAVAPPAGAHALGAAAVAFLRRYPPFDAMEEAPLRFVAARLTLGYFPAGTTVLTPDHGEPQALYVIQRGVVHLTPAAALRVGPQAVIPLRAGECFSFGALLEHRAVTGTYVAAADTFCYQLAREDFAWLLVRSRPFLEYGTRYLASLLAASRKLLHMQHSGSAIDEQALSRSLRSLVKRPPIGCAPDTPLADALQTMKREKVGSMLVHAADGKLVGILTARDVLERIALARRDLAQPVASAMTPDPLTLSADDTAYDAALLIARHGIRHVPVIDGGRTLGMVTERDLFALQRSNLRGIHRAIGDAGGVDDLITAADEIRSLAHALFAQGLSPEQLTHLVSTLNDVLTRRLLDIEAARHDLEGISWCWLAFGSEGRFEQTIATDQDNGLIFSDVPGRLPEDTRGRLLPFARGVNEALAACGFPLCRGEIMAGNPRWCLSRAEWQMQFELWIANTDPQALLGAAIFFDFRPLHGEARLAESLRAALFSMTAATPRFLRQLAGQALVQRPPLGLLADFVTEDVEHAPYSIDLKSAGARLFVDAARVLSLAAGTSHTNTAQRLREAGLKLNMTEGEIASAVEAFFFIQGLRLRAQLAAEARGGEGAPNRVDPDSLNEVDRRVLKESFRQARKLQTRLALDYGL